MALPAINAFNQTTFTNAFAPHTGQALVGTLADLRQMDLSLTQAYLDPTATTGLVPAYPVNPSATAGSSQPMYAPATTGVPFGFAFMAPSSGFIVPGNTAPVVFPGAPFQVLTMGMDCDFYVQADGTFTVPTNLVYLQYVGTTSNLPEFTTVAAGHAVIKCIVKEVINGAVGYSLNTATNIYTLVNGVQALRISLSA